jgi:hypothetical protein
MKHSNPRCKFQHVFHRFGHSVHLVISWGNYVASHLMSLKYIRSLKSTAEIVLKNKAFNGNGLMKVFHIFLWTSQKTLFSEQIKKRHTVMQDFMLTLIRVFVQKSQTIQTFTSRVWRILGGKISHQLYCPRLPLPLFNRLYCFLFKMCLHVRKLVQFAEVKRIIGCEES